MIITVLNNIQFANLMTAIGCRELAADSAFSTDELRTKNEPRLRAIIEYALADLSVGETVALLTKAHVPASPIASITEAIDSDQVAQRGLLVEQNHPKLGMLAAMEQPVHFAGQVRGDQKPAPALGQHSEQILREILELDKETIAGLIDRGVVSKGLKSNK